MKKAIFHERKETYMLRFYNINVLDSRLFLKVKYKGEMHTTLMLL
jgi:hypothetical protein